MDVEVLRKSPIGSLVPINGTDPRTSQPWDYWAYLPDPLPAAPNLSARAVKSAAKAGSAMARLDEAIAQLPRPDVLVRPIIRREAVSTSALEGTYASFEDVLEADFLKEGDMSHEQREIRNYIVATDLAVSQISDRRISRTFLGELQQTIVRGTRGDTPDAGDIRPHQVAIGARERPIHEARFVPCPPGDQLEAGMRDWEDWIAAEDDQLIVVKMALAHYQFETLHPFGDGNGRIGRLVALLQAMKAEELRWPVLNIAPWFESRRDDYQDGLLAVTTNGDFSAWVDFFSHAVESQATEGLDRIQSLIELRESLLKDLRAAGFKGSTVEIAELLIGYPVIDVPTASLLIGKSFEAANQAVAKLVKHGVLTEVTKRRKNRLFANYDALRITRWA